MWWFVLFLQIFIYLFLFLTLAHGMWDLVPRPGNQPEPPAVETSTVLTTGLPGKSLSGVCLDLIDTSRLFQSGCPNL